jgi:protein-L-isoaspartate(D-aspartate) O-methyltransferase
MPNFERQRSRMVRVHLARRGITDARVLAALGRVPREEFVPADCVRSAYADGPLPIGAGQTISQPYIVAMTAEALQLEGGERVLEVGTGSGYAAAVLAEITREVFSVERVPCLAEAARERLARLGYDNVQVACADGSLGWPEYAPYQAIAVAAVGPQVPPALLAQLAPGGRLIIPVGPEGNQTLLRVTRTGRDRYEEEPLADVRFVPLIGAQGF